MAAAPSDTIPLYPRHKRFVKGNGWELHSFCLSPDGKVIASGFHYNGKTYIDVYSSSRDKPTIVYSRESKKYSDRPYQLVSCHDSNSSVVICCVSDKLEVLELKVPTSNILKSLTVDGQIRSVAVMDGETFLSISRSTKVYVFDRNFEQTKQIKLEGIEKEEYPCDMAVVKDRIFVITIVRGFGNRALSYGKSGGNILTEFHNTIRQRTYAQSIAVSVKSGLVLVLWNWDQIIAYPFSENKPLLVFDLRNNIRRIRISEAGYLVCGSIVGEIRLYYLEQLFTFESMRRTLACLVSPTECEKLRRYFGVTDEEIRRLEASDEDKKLTDKQMTVRATECLLTVIEEKGQMSPYNIDKLTDAVSNLGDKKRISDLKGPMEGYSLHSKNMKITITEMITRKKASEDERNQLSSKLETEESKVKEHEKSLGDLQDQRYLQDQRVQAQEQEKILREDLKNKELEGERTRLTEAFQQSSTQMETLRAELEQIQMKSAKEIEALTEELKLTKRSKTESDRQIEALTGELNQTKQSKTESDRQIEALTEELKLTKLTITESDRQIKALTEKLNQTKQSETESDRQIELLTEELNQTKQSKTESDRQIETLPEELNKTKQSKTESDRQIAAFKEDLEHSKAQSDRVIEMLTEDLHKRSMEDKLSDDSEETRDEDCAILAAEFGRLTVAVAEHLTLDHCLNLAMLCNIPTADRDAVLRVSYIASPGLKLLDVLKKRKVVNMFDVTNLQKALAILNLEAVNRDVVAPYQEKIDKEQYELYKVEEMFTWEEVNAGKDRSAQRQIRHSQTSQINDTKPEYASQTEATAQLTVAGDEGRRSFLGGRHHHHLYTEHSIGKEGGTIHLANLSLTIPPDALHESHVIALSVMNESPFPLDREVDTARMTPLIKLEPLGLMFKKSLQLNIPHSALISEPEHHDVIIYSGHIEDSSDSIRWTEERSIPRQLKEKSVTVDIQCLTYLSASLVSQASAPLLHIVRALPFVDGIRNTDDDIILTICFCSDNDSEYNMLLSDYQTKLPLEQYSTLQLHRHSEKDEDDAGFLSVTVSSVNNTYVPEMEQAIKRYSVSHLCTASRVSHQVRLKKNQDTDRDIVDIMLTFSQAHYEPTQISLKARIKDLIISEESEKLLFGPITQGNKMYEDTVANISSSLDTEQCRELASYFQLTSEDTEVITANQDPGKMLMEILEERSLVDSQRMIHFFKGLKDCNLDKTAKLVSEYIKEIPKFTQEEEQKPADEKNSEETREDTLVSQYLLKKDQKTSRSSLSDQSVQTTLSSSSVSSDVHVETLTKEGYTEHEVVEALDISKNRPVMARKVLQCLREQPTAMEKSFQELVSKLSGQLDVDSCMEIAGTFRLSSDLKDRVKKSSEPGKVIFDELIQEQLITAASVSALDVALNRCGKLVLAEMLKHIAIEKQLSL